MTYLLGLDLGTTFTAAAIRRGDGPPEMVTLGNHSTCLPSVLHIGRDGSVLVGDAAERRAAVDPAGVAREFKRRVGDQTPMLLGDGGHTAHELTARLARHVVDFVRSREGGEPEQVSITHPAGWGGHKTALLGEALAEYGLGDSLLLSEPAAAAIAYAATERLAPGAAIGVYDLGGGTVDMAVLRKDAIGSFELVGEPAGDDHFGGVDFDELLFERIRNQFPELMSGLSADDPLAVSAVARLRREITEAKEALSLDTEAVIPVLLPSGQRQARLIRAEFEAMIRAALEETVDLMRRTIHSAGLTEDDLAAVLLVGGSSRIPLVTELLSAGLGRPVAVDADPKATVAIGAVLSASLDTVVEPVPAIVAMTAPPVRPTEPELPLHLATPSRPQRIFRPRVFAGAAGLALAAMATSAMVYSAQTADVGAPAQAATPDTTPSVAQPPASGTRAAAYKPARTTGHSSTSTTSKTAGSTTTTTPTAAATTTTTSPTERAGAPLIGPPPDDNTPPPTPTDPAPTSTDTTTPSTATQQPHQGPPPDDTTISSAPSTSLITSTTDPTPTTT
ncbi:Hsp70 family protein [Kutzneria chonburiensis]|uniref:Hsp70 family protein n=1 Tax=Kutzneria chonburiensis TaxID=1483604 RepID=A0ABV6MQ34_9PSEU|nr:Hsp70 family protein [Kutzneria chonburiensis]